ncbi:hypothetical protein C472_14897 [Halorubrum tebenquichense DSM 14210]|uniref:Uncharacterized protein n=1 Tax=Halorubrum tebenquichense DSM 14210 TaxID=1227485 RepID=M0DCL0_9EURY|nr:hypothetical protein C472_14897 [Halorubrum tebenquichense DSM 14210]
MSTRRNEKVPATADENIFENTVVDTLSDCRRHFGEICAVHRPTDVLKVGDTALERRKVEARYLLVGPDIVCRLEVSAEELHVPVCVAVRTGSLLRVANTVVRFRI